MAITTAMEPYITRTNFNSQLVIKASKSYQDVENNDPTNANDIAISACLSATILQMFHPPVK